MFFFFLGPIAACGIWQTVVEQAALRANSEKKKYPQLHWEGVYCLVQKECMYSALMLTLLFNVIQKYKPIKVLAF